MNDIELKKEFIIGVFSVLTVSIPLILKFLFAQKNKKKKNKEAKDASVNHIKLKHHAIFTRIKAYQSYVKTSFYMENKGKQEVFQNILSTELQNRYDLLLEMAETMDACCAECKISNEECNKLYNENLACLRRGVEMLSNYYKLGGYTEEEQKVLAIVLGKFNRWHEHRIQRMEETLPLICGSRFYPDCYTKQAVIFDMYLGTIADMLGDAEKTLGEINGDLRGMVFRGIKI